MVRAQVAGTLGIVGGTMGFNAIVTAFQAALSGLDQVVGNTAEAMMGFAKTTVRVTGELAQAVQAGGGLAESSLSRALASTGISSKVNLDALRQGAAGQAGAESIKAQMDLLRADRNLAGRDRSTLGTFQGFGNGPLAGIPGLGWIGQTPGNVE
jgi:hypothetical protein